MPLYLDCEIFLIRRLVLLYLIVPVSKIIFTFHLAMSAVGRLIPIVSLGSIPPDYETRQLIVDYLLALQFVLISGFALYSLETLCRLIKDVQFVNLTESLEVSINFNYVVGFVTTFMHFLPLLLLTATSITVTNILITITWELIAVLRFITLDGTLSDNIAESKKLEEERNKSDSESI